MAICNDMLKSRVIRFQASDDAGPANQAAASLEEVPAIIAVRAISQLRLRVQYDIRYMTLQRLEQALRDVGFALDDSYLQRFKRAVFAYCEDALREKLVLDEKASENTKITLNKNLVQDPRPYNWRHYS